MMFLADKAFPLFFAFLLGSESAVDFMDSYNAGHLWQNIYLKSIC